MSAAVNQTLYKNWLKYLFDRPVGRLAWFFEDDTEDFKASNDELVSLIGQTFEHCGEDLAGYSNEQIANGLSFILFNYASDTIYSIVQKGVAEERRIASVLAMKSLYRDCFARRCLPELTHVGGKARDPLNYVCYILWDESPLGRWGDTILEVMEYALYLPNPACAESGLLGIGQRSHQSPDKARAIIDRYLEKAQWLSPELKQYALLAKAGEVY